MPNVVPSITEAEHIGPTSTGDNIEAKRSADYGFDGSNWQRQPLPLIDKPWDYAVPTFNSTSDVWVFKLGGSGGTTQRTVTISYTDSTKSVISSVART